MLFPTYTFLIFFLIIIAFYSFSKTARGRNLVLLIGSYIFYGWWDWRFLSLIAFSTIIDFIAAQKIEAAKTSSIRNRWLLMSIVTNLGFLGIFKYFNFFADSLLAVGNGLGWHLDAPTLNIILPVGISFYTFQTLAYSIDVYRGEIEPERDFITYAVFVSFFPQLVAGPIERANKMLPQFHRLNRITAEGVRNGISFCLIGLFMKLVVADNAAVIVDNIFKADIYTFGSSLSASYAFALQIYGDFAGYSSIAIGVGLILGFNLQQNFRQPYFATSFQEFWRRWHISLSTWLRDYLYIPLGGNRFGLLRTYRNLIVTMILGGLWHGAAWTFVIWGLLHGGYLAIERAVFGKRQEIKNFPQRVIMTVVVFNFVAFAWIFFRAASFEQALDIIQGFMSPGIGSLGSWEKIVLIGSSSFGFDWWREKTKLENPLVFQSGLFTGMIWAVLILLVTIYGGKQQTFIYFQF